LDRIVVTGMGVISAIGNTVAENRASLVKGTCGLGRLEMFPSKFSTLLPVGEIKITTEALKEKLEAHEAGITRTT
jgi:3-oxoacyl-(acyl-carrier-protein) synthase